MAQHAVLERKRENAIVAETSVVTLLVLLIVVALVAAAVQYIHIPYTVALVITGLALALVPGMPQLTLSPDIILIIFLPVLLFKGAFDLDLAEVRANLTPIILLAVPGVVATAGLAGLALHLVIRLPWDVALLFGAIIAATDPIAVLSIFGEMGVPRRLATTVAAESLFNDGIALVLVATILGIVTTRTFSVGATIDQFIVEALGGLALGVIVAIVGGVVLRHIDNALLETTVTLIIAYGGYLLATAFHSSGPLETVMAALLLSSRTQHMMSPTTQLQAGASWEFFDFLANSLLFLLVGLALHADGARLLASLGFEIVWFVIVATFVVVAERGLIVWIIGRVLARLGNPWPQKWQLVITWAGLRGAVSLAAALSLPPETPQRDTLLALTFGIVLTTLMGHGLTIRPLLNWLGMVQKSSAHHEFEVALGRLRATEAAMRELATLSEHGVINAQLSNRLSHEYTHRVADLRAQMDQIMQQDDDLEHQMEQEVRRHLLQVERETASALAEHGQLPQDTQRDVLADIDSQLIDIEKEG